MKITQEQFIELQKAVYRPGKEWEDLIAAYNKHTGLDLPGHLRSTYIVILKAIANKQGFDFKPLDLQQYAFAKR